MKDHYSDRYASLRWMMSSKKHHPEFGRRLFGLLAKYAKDDKLSLIEFAFLVKKALKFYNKHKSNESVKCDI